MVAPEAIIIYNKLISKSDDVKKEMEKYMPEELFTRFNQDRKFKRVYVDWLYFIRVKRNVRGIFEKRYLFYIYFLQLSCQM